MKTTFAAPVPVTLTSDRQAGFYEKCMAENMYEDAFNFAFAWGRERVNPEDAKTWMLRAARAVRSMVMSGGEPNDLVSHFAKAKQLLNSSVVYNDPHMVIMVANTFPLESFNHSAIDLTQMHEKKMEALIKLSHQGLVGEGAGKISYEVYSEEILRTLKSLNGLNVSKTLLRDQISPGILETPTFRELPLETLNNFLERTQNILGTQLYADTAFCRKKIEIQGDLAIENALAREAKNFHIGLAGALGKHPARTRARILAREEFRNLSKAIDCDEARIAAR